MDMDMEVQGNYLASYLDRSSYSFLAKHLLVERRASSLTPHSSGTK